MTPRNPTNTDLLKEILEVKGTLTALRTDVDSLKEWKIAVEAAKEAIKEYQTLRPEKENVTAKALAAVVGVIGLLTAVILALINT